MLINGDVTEKKNSAFINLRPAGPLDFPRLVQEGGRGYSQPLYLGSWATYRHVASGIRKIVKNITKLLGSFFLGQVKVQVTIGRERSNFTSFNIFRQSGAEVGNQKSYSAAEMRIGQLFQRSFRVKLLDLTSDERLCLQRANTLKQPFYKIDIFQ